MNRTDREIWKLLWPVLLLTLAQKLGSAFEGVIVSVNSSDELMTMGICGPYITLITTVSYGIGIAVNSAVGRACAGGSWETSYRSYIKVFVLLAVACGVAISSAAAAMLYPAFGGFADTAARRAEGYLYMLPYIAGSPVLLIYSLLISGSRGLGDARCGMYMTFISVPVQLGVSCIGYAAFGLTGLGWGTLISRLAACLYGAKRFCGMLPDTGGDVPPGGNTLWDFIKLALPVSLSKAVSPTGNALINSLILSVSPLLVSVKGLGGRLEPFFYLPAMAMCSVTVTMVSRERDMGAMASLCRRLCLWSVLPTAALAAAAGLLNGGIWNLIAVDTELAAAGIRYWSVCLWAYPMIAMEMNLTSVLQALGKGFPALAATIIRVWAVQAPLTYVFAKQGAGQSGPWLAYLASNAVSLGMCAIWTYYQIKKQNRRTV